MSGPKDFYGAENTGSKQSDDDEESTDVDKSITANVHPIDGKSVF